MARHTATDGAAFACGWKASLSYRKILAVRRNPVIAKWRQLGNDTENIDAEDGGTVALLYRAASC